jgi:hypothetical protein
VAASACRLSRFVLRFPYDRFVARAVRTLPLGRLDRRVTVKPVRLAVRTALCFVARSIGSFRQFWRSKGLRWGHWSGWSHLLV